MITSTTASSERITPGTHRQRGFDELGTPLFDTTFVVLDLETTGLSPERDRITEVGAVKSRGGQVLGELRTFVHPGRPIPPAVTALTGIDDHAVRDAPSIGLVLGSLRDFLAGAVLVAHNAAFDVGFLRAACRREGHPTLEPQVIDTARLARRLLGDELRSFRLASVARHLRARTSPSHRALADARATLDVLHGLIERAGRYGATTLEDLSELTRSRSDPAFRRRGLVAGAPRTTGVYRFVDAHGEVLYVGKATDLRARLRTYFGQDPRRRIADLVRETDRVEWTPTATLLEAEVRELREIQSRRPRYNRRSLRPRPPSRLVLTREPFPRLSIARRTDGEHPWRSDPLAGRRQAELVAAVVADAASLRTCATRLRRAQDHPACVLKDLARCGAPCDGTQDGSGHDETVGEALALFEDPGPLLERLRQRMEAAARRGRFERAAELRHLLHATARALADGRERAALGRLSRLVACRTTASGTELVVLAEGRLLGTAMLPGEPDQAAVAATADELASNPPHDGQDVEELGLLLAWLRRPDVRLMSAEPGLWWPARGGAALAATVDEARTLARRLRRDRQRLAGDKVRHLDPGGASSPAGSASDA